MRRDMVHIDIFPHIRVHQIATDITLLCHVSVELPVVTWTAHSRHAKETLEPMIVSFTC